MKSVPDSAALLFFVLFFLFLKFLFVFLVFLVLVFFLLFVFIIIVKIVGDGIQMDGMRLHDFEFHFTLRAVEDFAFLNFVFVHVNFCGTIRAANHGCDLLVKIIGVPASKRPAAATSVLYTARLIGR